MIISLEPEEILKVASGSHCWKVLLPLPAVIHCSWPLLATPGVCSPLKFLGGLFEPLMLPGRVIGVSDAPRQVAASVYWPLRLLNNLNSIVMPLPGKTVFIYLVKVLTEPCAASMAEISLLCAHPSPTTFSLGFILAASNCPAQSLNSFSCYSRKVMASS